MKVGDRTTNKIARREQAPGRRQSSKPEELSPLTDEFAPSAGLRPQDECDLVMKGGITSGIVYPPALELLSKKYSFNSIGGTSAGAIAAASAAAAEYTRRRSGGDRKGFGRLTSLAKELGGKERKLRRLFDAPPETRIVIELADALGLLGGDKKGLPTKVVAVVWAILKANWRFTLFALLTSVILLVFVGASFGVFLAEVLTDRVGINGWVPPTVITAALAVLTGVVIFLARETVKRVLAVIIATLSGGALSALFSLAIPWLMTFVFDNRALSTPAVGLGILFAFLFGFSGGALATIGYLAWVGWRNVPKNYMGIVRGHDRKAEEKLLQRRYGWQPESAEASDAAASDQAPGERGRRKRGIAPRPTVQDAHLLADWLCARLDEIAGQEHRPGPLTFGDLNRAGITLKMLSTDLSLGLPFEFPHGTNFLIFNEEEMRDLFPAYVVDHLKKHAARGDTLVPHDKLPDGYHFLPDPENLPVAVATRMSLAVPIFISAVPLYTVSVDGLHKYGQDGLQLRPPERTARPAKQDRDSESREKANDLLLNFFSDGGTTSNFPIHFFDSWLPRRPTFGINLTYVPEGAAMDEKRNDSKAVPVAASYLSTYSGETFEHHEAGLRKLAEAARPDDGGTRATAGTAHTVPPIVLPEVGERPSPEWKPITSGFDFFAKVLDTAREHRDNLLSMLPGYAERIVQVRLRAGEGGMNLAMSHATIQELLAKGEAAGKELCGFKFNPHRWTRFRVIMGHLERELEELSKRLRSPTLNYSGLIYPEGYVDFNGQHQDPAPPADGRGENNLEDEWREKAFYAVQELIEVVERWKAITSAGSKEKGPDYSTPLTRRRRVTEYPDRLRSRRKVRVKSRDGSPQPELRHFARNNPKPSSQLRVVPVIPGRE